MNAPVETTRHQRIVRWAENHPVVSMVLVVFAVIGGANPAIDLYTKLTEPTDKAERAATAKSLIADLERIKVLLPIDQSFSDCLSRRPPPTLDAIEACARERKATLADPIQILDRNIVSLKLVFADDILDELIAALHDIRYLSYEMQNNQVVLERWLRAGCGSGITYVDSLTPQADDTVRCTLSVEGYRSFLKRSKTNVDRVSPMVTESMHKDRVKVFIVQGTDDTIHQYFRKSNNMLYTNLLRQTDELVAKLKPYVN